MAIVRPFRALRPASTEAADIAAVPYDVVNAEEARQLAASNPLSFLHVSRAEIDLPPGTDPYSSAVYERAAKNFASLRARAYVLEPEPSLYVYRLRMGDHEQTGVAAGYSVDDYEHGLIKKHECTRLDKEDDRTRHIVAVAAQTGPVLLTYRASDDVDAIVAHITRGDPLFGFEAADGVRHTVWRASDSDRDALVEAFARVSALYIADGHHRAASAARVRREWQDRAATSGKPVEADWMLAVAFPHDEMQILPYNRIVQDLAGRSPADFLTAVSERFTIEPGSARPQRRGELAMYLEDGWRILRPRLPADTRDPIASLDVSLLQDRLLGPVLHITDVRSDKRIDFVGGARGTAELERQVGSGHAAVAFSLFPASIEDLMTVADAGAIMPPKSTWFEPKLRDGLLVHLI